MHASVHCMCQDLLWLLLYLTRAGKPAQVLFRVENSIDFDNNMSLYRPDIVKVSPFV